MKKGFTLAEVLLPKRTSGIDNKIIYSREGKGQALSNLNKKSAAFTLAEVLITLAIIGVVAALTIPTVVHKYQQQQFYAAFMKAHNTLATAFQLSVAENGELPTWEPPIEDQYDGGDIRVNEPFFNKYMAPYLRIDKTCPAEGSRPSSCPTSYNYYYGPTKNEEGGSIDAVDYDIVFLQDGSALFEMMLNSDAVYLSIDTNGTKGPNVLGRDIFTFELAYYKEAPGTRLYPFGIVDMNNMEHVSNFIRGGYKLLSLDDIINGYDDGYFVCNPKVNGSGSACGARLILEGKMDY